MQRSQGGEHDDDAVARAAWLHFVGGLTQSEVARRLDVPTTRAHRYIARAQSRGLVRVFVDVAASDCVALETALIERHGLSTCRVAMETPEPEPLPLRALGAVGGDWLMRAIASGRHGVIGIGNGRTLSAVVNGMGRIAAGPTRFVSILGGLTRSGAANPYDVIHALAQKTGGEAFLMPAPLFADTAEDRRVLMAQSALAVTTRLVAEASLIVVGIGDVGVSSGVAPAATTALADREAIGAIRARGARAEILGQFLDAAGAPVPTPHDARVMAPALDALKGREVVAVAGGASKVEAIRASLGSGLLSGLITDEATARALVGDADRDGGGDNNDERQGGDTSCTNGSAIS
ncbi:MAG: sugar-binding transcriptional regulator [Paracoccaceae bacterium]